MRLATSVFYILVLIIIMKGTEGLRRGKPKPTANKKRGQKSAKLMVDIADEVKNADNDIPTKKELLKQAEVDNANVSQSDYYTPPAPPKHCSKLMTTRSVLRRERKKKCSKKHMDHLVICRTMQGITQKVEQRKRRIYESISSSLPARIHCSKLGTR